LGSPSRSLVRLQLLALTQLQAHYFSQKSKALALEIADDAPGIILRSAVKLKRRAVRTAHAVVEARGIWKSSRPCSSAPPVRVAAEAADLVGAAVPELRPVPQVPQPPEWVTGPPARQDHQLV
jgi:hypothetical protein